MNRRKLIKVVVVLLTLGALFFFLYKPANSFLHKGEAELEIEVIPADSTITINGESVKAGTVFVNPGSHKVEVTKEGFLTESRSIEVFQDNTAKVYITLAADSADAQKFYRDNPKLQIKSEEYGSITADQIQSSISSNYPIIKQLPYISADFRVDYGVSQKFPDNPDKIALYITAPVADIRELALNWISLAGYNPADYEIIFLDYTNPFYGGD